MLSTFSSCYDSTAVSVFAREASCEEAISFGRVKGVRTTQVPRSVRRWIQRIHLIQGEGWRALERPEPFFIASEGFGEEVHFKAAEKNIESSVLFTGYYSPRLGQAGHISE